MTINRTPEFRQAVDEKRSALPETKRRKVRKGKPDAPSDGKDVFDREYLKEGYIILGHIHTLTRMLAHIRKPYLNVDSRANQFSRQTSVRTLDLASSDESWSSIRYLTNEERDQIDLQARVILTRCSDRVKEMEALEKRRVELAASKANPIVRLLPARLRQEFSSSTVSDFIAAHHASITWYLSRRLAEASQIQKEMQEERVKRQMERTQTLGSGAAREAAFIGDQPLKPIVEQKIATGGGSWLESASSNLASSWAATIGAPSRPDLTRTSTVPVEEPDDDDDDDDIELTASQIMQFEDENAAILRSVQDTLASVHQAESRLMEISVLQTELVAHLTHQTELTDQLYEDAIATTWTTEKGNTQLEEAKRRGKDNRLFILIFLIGASLSLLFIHYY